MTRYLKDLPKRLSQHPSLRDTVSLFYRVWTDHCRQKPAVDFINLPEYGKAIRSLRLALSSDQAFTTETLASATILHRVEEVFNPSRHKVLHQQGIASLLNAVGKPRPNDKFQATLMAEIYIIMVRLLRFIFLPSLITSLRPHDFTKRIFLHLDQRIITNQRLISRSHMQLPLVGRII
jgi:hypothetical protein